MMVDELDKIYDMVCKIAELEKSDIKNDRSKAILLGLEKIKQQLDATNSNQRRIERRIKAIAKVLIAFAKLDFSKKTHLTDSHDYIDAVASGINMLGEELQVSTVSLQEKEVLLKEVHHRVKNNLQIITSLFNLQADFIKDNGSLLRFMEIRNRVQSMALVHEQLYESKNLSKIDFGKYLVALVDSLSASYGFVNNDKIDLQIESTLHHFRVDTAIPCGLILNELLTNCYKYAFPAKNKRGTIKISFSKKSVLSENDSCILTVEDDGIGISPDIDIAKTTTLGLQLVHLLVKQLGGDIQLDRSKGTRFTITVKDTKHT